MSLTDSILGLLGSDSNLGSIAGLLNASGADTSAALGGSIPAVLGSLADRATEQGGSDAVLNMVEGADDGILSDIGGFLTNRSTDNDAGMMAGIFGDNSEGIVQSLAGNLGLGGGMIGKLLPMVAPLVLGFIKGKGRQEGLDSRGLLGMLATEKADLAGKGLLGGLGAKGLGAAAAGAAGLGAIGAAGSGALNNAGAAATGAVGKLGDSAKGVAGGVTAGVAGAGRDIKGAAAVPSSGGGLPKWLLPLLLVVGALILIPLLLSQCGSSADDGASTVTTVELEAPDLSPALNAALDGTGIDGISGSIDGDTATLTGTAISEDAKAAAETAALSVDGINNVVNNITVEAETASGDLAPALTSALEASGIAGISGELDGDTATLVGTVASEDEKAAAEAAALGVDGINTVVNRITVEAAPTNTIVDIAAGNPDFSTLVGALGNAGLADTLAGDGPFTVFAPDNAAFEALGEVPEGDELANVLSYHVVPGKLTAADLATGTLTTVQGTDLDVVVESGSVTINGVAVKAADIDADNGVIHVLDGVLIPATPTLNAELGIENINFEVGSATITADSRVELQKAVDFMNANADTRVKIDGHTDSDGGEAGNLTLSQDRADSVKAFLVENGIDADRMETEGFGESQPIAPNDTGENKAKNRRIEFSVL